MKKILLTIMVLGLLVGCGSTAKGKTTVCTLKNDTTSTVVTILSDEDVMKNISTRVEQKATEEEATFFKTIMGSLIEELNKVKGLKYSIDYKDGNVVLVGEVDLVNIDKEALKKLQESSGGSDVIGGVENDASLKNFLETQMKEYTCK